MFSRFTSTIMDPLWMAWPFCLSTLPSQILCLLPVSWVPYSLASKQIDFHNLFHNLSDLPHQPAWYLLDSGLSTCPWCSLRFFSHLTHTQTHISFGKDTETYTTSICHMGRYQWSISSCWCRAPHSSHSTPVPPADDTGNTSHSKTSAWIKIPTYCSL